MDFRTQKATTIHEKEQVPEAPEAVRAGSVGGGVGRGAAGVPPGPGEGTTKP